MQPILQINRVGRRGFTIVELLVVIAIIAILSAVFFGVAGSVRERSRIARAETELSMLAQYLEQYKAHYGDYPRVAFADANSPSSVSKLEGEDGNVALYNALNGMRGVASNSAVHLPEDRQRPFIDRSKFRYAFAPSQDPPANPADPETAPAVLLDPWGNAYRYYYMNHELGSWENNSYVLYSVGESGEHQEPALTGYPDRSHPRNLDNIYAN